MRVAAAVPAGDSSPLPSRVDLRPFLEAFALAPRVQGERGTCSVFAVTTAIEYAAAKRDGRGRRLSVEYLNWASNRVRGDTTDGGLFSDLWKGFQKHGICPEEDMPYRAVFHRSIEPSPEARAAAKTLLSRGLRLRWIKEWDPRQGLSDAQLVRIRETLAGGWPVCGGFLWPKHQVWKDDILQMCPRDQVRDGHSVLLVGYRDGGDLPGGGAFVVRNTSGALREGLLTYEYVRAYMNDAAWIDFEDAGKSTAPASPLPEFVSLLSPPPAGRNGRVSSNEQPAWRDSNLDMTLLPPGASVDFPVLEGPGLITHIWLTSHAGWVGELNSLSLRIWWDDRKEPGVEVPLGMFFGVSDGMPAPVMSFPVQVSPSGSLTCYWRMPFSRSARIRVTNDNPDRTAGLYWQVDWLKLEALPPGTPYFHARYRREYPAAPGDYRIADLTGRGHYVGTVMAVTLAQDGWFGEGDDFFYIDGEAVPSLQGTGTEDYFNDAWGFRTRTGLWFGQPRWQGYRAGDTGVAYRWNLLDPIGFSRSLLFTIEHKGNRDVAEEGFYLERPDFLSSVAFWYQLGEPAAWEPLPSWSDRRVPWRTHHLVRAFRDVKVTGAVRPEVRTEGFFGARPVLAWPNTKPGERMSLPFRVDEGGRFAVRLIAMGAPGEGRCDVEIDGEVVLGNVDFGADATTELDILLGTLDLAQGAHTFGLAAVASAPSSDISGPVAVELLRLLALPPEATRAVKTRNEAHFIRLGIGRAVYAYRLAYGQLPESLQELHKAGVMPERYLRDENLVPLESRQEGEFFIVESRGPGAWKHRWQGLDARR